MILENEALIRLLSFAVVLCALLALEQWRPRRERSQSIWLRWSNNFAITLVNTVLLRLIFPAAAVGLAIQQESSGFGLLKVIGFPGFANVLLGVVLLDLIIYGQHRLFHRVPWLWRIHRMHHSDVDIDVTTGIRFHPIEIILSMLIKLLAVWLLGAPAAAVILFEVLLNASAMFNHSNLELPAPADQWIRRVIVTPDMHRVHHSIDAREMNHNFGFCLSWWDHLFNSYVAEPAAGHRDMQTGLERFRQETDIRLDKLLLQPFVKSPEPDDGAEPDPDVA
jgi:sterol desaturase/sphingolipid hydroxylase (fatty acid hydroxylase superfamily)